MASPRPPYGRLPTQPPASAGPLRLGHLVPERRPVVIQRANPAWTSLAPDDPKRQEIPEIVDVILQGYVFGDRCPGVVKAELSSIEEVYLRTLSEATAQARQATDPDDPAGTLGQGTSASQFVIAWHTFLRETILALVPGMTPGEADVLAAVPPGGEGPGTDLLRYLGVWRDAEDGETAADPEAVGEADPPSTSTTAPSSPTSLSSTDLDPPSS